MPGLSYRAKDREISRQAAKNNWKEELMIINSKTSGAVEPISSKVSRSQNLTVLSAEPARKFKKQSKFRKYSNHKDIQWEKF